MNITVSSPRLVLEPPLTCLPLLALPSASLQLDDLSPAFQWYADGDRWHVDHETDPAKSAHFMGTYRETLVEVSPAHPYAQTPYPSHSAYSQGAMMRLVFQAQSISVFGTKGIYYGNYTGTDYGRREGALLTTQSASMARSHCRSWATWTIQCIRQSSTLAKGLIQTRNIPLWVQGGTTRDPGPPRGTSY